MFSLLLYPFAKNISCTKVLLSSMFFNNFRLLHNKYIGQNVHKKNVNRKKSGLVILNWVKKIFKTKTKAEIRKDLWILKCKWKNTKILSTKL